MFWFAFFFFTSEKASDGKMQLQKCENEFKYNVNVKGLAAAHKFVVAVTQQ